MGEISGGGFNESFYERVLESVPNMYPHTGDIWRAPDEGGTLWERLSNGKWRIVAATSPAVLGKTAKRPYGWEGG